MPQSPGSRNKRLRAKRGRRHDTRASASERGYDNDWAKLRHWYATLHPLCEHCLDRGLTVPVAEVDHKRPFRGLSDPLRLDPTNLQSLCKSCHARKTHADGKNPEGA